MAGPLTPITQQDFSRGENTVTNPYLVRPDQLQQAVNVILDEHGSLRTRDGTLSQGATSPHPNWPMVKIFDYIKVDGSVIQLVLLYGTVGNNALYRRDTTPWTFQATLGAVFRTPDMLTFNGLTIIANGNSDTLYKYDGTTVTALSAGPFIVAAPRGAHIANHLGFLWAWNTNSVSSVSSGPSSLAASDLNNQDSWPLINQTLIAKDDGQSGQGLALFTIAETGISPTATIIAFKDFSAYECTGVLGTTTFAVQKVKSDMGCVAPRSIQFISGFGIIRITHRGFALYDGVNDTLISEEERPRIFGRDSYVGLDWPNINRSMSAQVANPPLYLCACPVSGSNGTLQRIFIYDLVRRAWTIATYPTDLSTMQLSLVPNQLPVVYTGDASAGKVRRIFAGDMTDDGSDVNWAILTRAFSQRSAVTRSYWQRMLADFFSLSTGSQVTANFYLSPTAAVGQVTQTLSPVAITQLNSYSGWGVDPWGTTPWGSQNAAIITDTVLAYGMGFIANSVQVGMNGSGPMKLRQLELHARVKPSTRATAGVQ